jgi:hypothetical protein
MNLETVIENDEQKSIFLKAIILGINYGKTDNADVYRHNILTEIKKLNEKINVNKKSLNNSLEKNKQLSSAGPRRACSNVDQIDLLKVVGATKERMIPVNFSGSASGSRWTNQKKTEEQKVQRNPGGLVSNAEPLDLLQADGACERLQLESTEVFRSTAPITLSKSTGSASDQSLMDIGEKYNNNISNLENQKNYTITLINNLTASNYQYNYSKINLLKSNLINIDKEIEKNKINILKHKEKNIKNSQTQENFEKMLKTRENIRKDFNKENNNESEKNTEDKLKNKNLSGELEKTLSSLTNLLS